jgi:FKBP-type peptidyl-prolyl cis-trans isomerase FkpA
MIQPGTGPVADTGNYVTVNYSGISWSGKKFDSNTDTAFHHVEPYSFVAGAGRMMKGFDEAVLMMNKGAKVKLYIPSMLGYGANPTTPLIKPFEHVIFDLELVDIKEKEPATPNTQGPPMNLNRPQSN